MKRYSILSQSILAILVAFCLGACTSDGLSELEETLSPSNKHTMKMKFVGNVIGFDQQKSSNDNMQTKAITSSWNDGDKIYITFYNGSTIVPGVATYSSTSDWSVSYDGNLAVGSNLKCEARYFVNATSYSSSLVSLNNSTEIYEDLDATYDYNDNSLVIFTTLVPKTGRIRFKGQTGNIIRIMGVSTYTSFSLASNSFSMSSCLITSAIGANGFSPYIHGYLTESERYIGIVSQDYAFTRTCTKNILDAGESGYMDIPSETTHSNWQEGLYIKASGVKFKMIPITGHSEGFYLMAETETTEALYNSVLGTPSSSKLPVSFVTYSNVLSFIEKLNDETGLTFSLPSLEQWKYAAKGGNRSHGYTYSGSNNIDEVAWYDANSNHEIGKQDVKTKAPNELGLYDMSGNVWECTAIIPSTTYYYLCGGASHNSAGGCCVTWCLVHEYDNNKTEGASDTGFRIILTFTD